MLKCDVLFVRPVRKFIINNSLMERFYQVLNLYVFPSECYDTFRSEALSIM